MSESCSQDTPSVSSELKISIIVLIILINSCTVIESHLVILESTYKCSVFE